MLDIAARTTEIPIIQLNQSGNESAAIGLGENVQHRRRLPTPLRHFSGQLGSWLSARRAFESSAHVHTQRQQLQTPYPASNSDTQTALQHSPSNFSVVIGDAGNAIPPNRSTETIAISTTPQDMPKSTLSPETLNFITKLAVGELTADMEKTNSGSSVTPMSEVTVGRRSRNNDSEYFPSASINTKMSGNTHMMACIPYSLPTDYKLESPNNQKIANNNIEQAKSDTPVCFRPLIPNKSAMKPDKTLASFLGDANIAVPDDNVFRSADFFAPGHSFGYRPALKDICPDTSDNASLATVEALIKIRNESSVL